MASPHSILVRNIDTNLNTTHTHARVILLNLLHHFDFSLGKIMTGFKREDFLGVNRATLGPQDIGEDPDKPAKLGMYLKITPRTAVAPTSKL